MIRRGFWLAAGAVLGIAGYRQVRQLGQALTGRSGRALAGKQSALLAPRRALSGQRQAAELAARHAGLAGRHAGLAGRAAGLAGGNGAVPGRHGVRAGRRTGADGGPPAVRAAARGLAVLAFVRDVREGMAEYLVRHNGTAGSTLGRQDRAGAEGIVPRGQQRWSRQESEQDRQAP